MPYLLLTLAALFWGGNYVVGHVLVQGVDPILMTEARWALTALLLGSLARAVFPQRPGVSGNFPIVAGLFVLEQRYRHHWRHAGRNLHPHHPPLRWGVEHPVPAYSTAGLASV